MKKSKVQNSKCKIFFAVIFFALFIGSLPPVLIAQSNRIDEIPNGGYIREWLISNRFQTEIDAGNWENFNRFNIERLPVRDWLAPFGGVSKIKPAAGIQKVLQSSNSQNPQSRIPDSESNATLPEIGALTSAKTFADATEISWRKILVKDSNFDFYSIYGGREIGTAYAAADISAAANVIAFLETDGFAGQIWLNGAKIYDGFSLNVEKIVRANFSKGDNLLLVRSSGVSGDYWRKNGGWNASLRLWKDKLSAKKSAQFKPSGAGGTINYLEGFHVDPVSTLR